MWSNPNLIIDLVDPEPEADLEMRYDLTPVKSLKDTQQERELRGNQRENGNPPPLHQLRPE